MQKMARETAEKLAADGVDCAIINPRFTKPLDADVHSSFAANADVIVTFEDHVLPGGYGSAVLELLNEKRIATPLVRIGWPDAFIEHASTVDYLRNKYGLTAENAYQKTKAELAKLGVQNRQQSAAA
jgi:1-deoxy-D-xylulose-5-phosphate synthase